MRRLGFILTAALGLTSCLSGPLIEDSPGVQGEVSISLRQEHDVATKADDGLPEVDDFIVEVHETATSRLFFRKTYADAQGVRIPLNKGEHRLLAYYGDPQKAGFKACYYVADTLFNVQPQQLSQIEAVARLGNAMAAVKFGRTLNLDYGQFYAEVVASNGAELTFVQSETRAGYVPVGEISLNLYVFTQDRWMVYRTEPITCQARDFITFNVDTQRLGDLSVEIVIDNGVDTVVKEIEVPAEAAPQDGPSIAVSGFEDNVLRVCEADVREFEGYKADIVAMGGVSSCILEIQSQYLASKGIPSSVDLAALDAQTQAQLNAVGLKFLKNMAGSRLSYVDFSGFINHISQNVAYHPDYETLLADFSLTVTDKTGKSASSQVYTIAIDKSQAEVLFNDYDVWATKLAGATLNVTKGDPSKYVLKCVKASDMLYTSVQTISPQSINGNTVKFGPFTGLASGTGYKVWAVYNNNTYNNTPEKSFTTENAQQVANNSFEQHTYEIFNFSIAWTTAKGSRVWYQLYAPGETDPWWAVNSTATLDKEFWAAYWFYKCFPTVCVTNNNPYIGSRSVLVASIAIHDSGSEVTTGDAISGELYIGKADNSSEHNNAHISDGHSFGSRPTAMSFYYKFDYHDSPFAAEIFLYDASGEEVAAGKYVSETSDVSSWKKAEIPLEYDYTNKKVSKIYIRFVSSSTGSTASRNLKLNVLDSNGSAMTTENVHAGNVVWLDYVQLHY